MGRKVDGGSLQPVFIDAFSGDVNKGALRGITVTLTSANVVTAIDIPDEAKGFKLYPNSNDIFFSVNVSTGARATSSATSIGVSALSDGNIAKASISEVRSLMPGTSRKLYMRCASAGNTVEVDFWG